METIPGKPCCFKTHLEYCRLRLPAYIHTATNQRRRILPNTINTNVDSPHNILRLPKLYLWAFMSYGIAFLVF